MRMRFKCSHLFWQSLSRGQADNTLYLIIPCFAFLLSLCPDSISHITPHHMNAAEIDVQFSSISLDFFQTPNPLIWCVTALQCVLWPPLTFYTCTFSHKCSIPYTGLIHSWTRIQLRRSSLPSFQILRSRCLYVHCTVTLLLSALMDLFISSHICIWSWLWTSQLLKCCSFFLLCLSSFVTFSI